MAKIADAKVVITADNQAEAQIVRLQAQVQALNAKMTEGARAAQSGFSEARGQVRLLSEDLGIHLNRELVNIIASSKLAQGILAAAFAPAAIAGFIDVAENAYKGLVSISEQIGGLSAESKKFMEETSADNKEFIKMEDEVRKAKEAAALAGLEGEARFRLELQFATSDAERLRLQILQLGAAQGKLGGAPGLDFQALSNATRTSKFNALGPVGGLVALVTSFKELQKGNDDWLKQTELINKEIEKANAEYQKSLAGIKGLNGADGLGKTNAALEEATARAREFATEMQKASGVIAKETLTPGQQKSAEIQNTINDLRVAALTMTPQQQAAATKFIDELYYALQTQNDKNEKDFAKELRDGLDKSLKAVLDVSPNLPSSPLDQLKTVEKQIQNIFSAERAGEEALKAAADASGAPIIETEQKIVALRKEHNEELAKLIAQFQVLAGEVASTNPEMIEKSKQFSAELQKLNTGFKTISTSVRGALTNDVGSFFEGIISGSESASQAFKRFAQSLLADLAQIITKMYITALLSKLLGSVFGGFGGGNPNVSGAATEPGFFSGGRRAAGGPVTAGVPYLVGERGPEPFIPSTSGTILPHSALMGGGANVQVNVINQSSQQVDAHQQSSHYDAAIDQHIVNVVLKDIQRNGPLRTAMSG